MTLVQLRHLLSLAQTGSFSKSSAALFITQPALSRSIQALEAELGQPLFDRIGRRSELTPFGARTVERARDLVQAADDLRASATQADDAQVGMLRVGMGSGPGALLTVPLLLTMARERPRLHVEVARAGTELLVQRLRERALDALVVDARSLRPAPDLHVQQQQEMAGAFLVRAGHPLLRGQKVLGFADLLRHPIASTPLSDEVARILVERYGAQAHPEACVTLRCEDIASLVQVVRDSDAVLLTVRGAAPGLVELPLQPTLRATARFALVTLARRTEAPGLGVLRDLMQALMVDAAPPALSRPRSPRRRS